jgi:hypothetical protein
MWASKPVRDPKKLWTYHWEQIEVNPARQKELAHRAQRKADKFDRIEKRTKALRKGMAKTQSATNKLKSSVKLLGAAMLGTFGAHTLIRAVQNVAKTFMDFEQSMANVKAITRANQDEFERLSKLARDLGGSTKYTASQVSELEVAYGKLGFTVTEIEKVAEATLDLAAAVGSELGRAAEVAGGVLRGFQMDAIETTRVTDVMARSFTSSALDMEKFANAMTYVAPIAANIGLTLEETTSLLAVLADNMIDGSMAGTSLRMILSQLSKDGRPLAERLSELSEKGLTLAEAEKEVGRRAQTALLVLTKQADKLPELTKNFENAGGAAKEMADVQLNTLQGKLTILGSAFAELKITMGELATASGEVAGAIDLVTLSIQEFTKFLKSEWFTTIRSATRAFWDFLVPTRILARNWDKLFPPKAEWRNAGVGRLGGGGGAGGGGGGGAGGGGGTRITGTGGAIRQLRGFGPLGDSNRMVAGLSPVQGMGFGGHGFWWVNYSIKC